MRRAPLLAMVLLALSGCSSGPSMDATSDLPIAVFLSAHNDGAVHPPDVPAALNVAYHLRVARGTLGSQAAVFEKEFDLAPAEWANFSIMLPGPGTYTLDLQDSAGGASVEMTLDPRAPGAAHTCSSTLVRASVSGAQVVGGVPPGWESRSDGTVWCGAALVAAF